MQSASFFGFFAVGFLSSEIVRSTQSASFFGFFAAGFLPAKLSSSISKLTSTDSSASAAFLDRLRFRFLATKLPPSWLVRLMLPSFLDDCSASKVAGPFQFYVAVKSPPEGVSAKKNEKIKKFCWH